MTTSTDDLPAAAEHCPLLGVPVMVALRRRLSRRDRYVPFNARIVLLFLIGACFTQFPGAAFAHEYQPPPAEFSTVACYGLVEAAGRSIAWARWEKHLSVEKTRSAPFRAHTPTWVIDLVQGWIDDAYQWRATEEQIRQWADELGSVEDLPNADALTVHETIAIWMRRIGRQCNELDADARGHVQIGASATLMSGDASLEK